MQTSVVSFFFFFFFFFLHQRIWSVHRSDDSWCLMTIYMPATPAGEVFVAPSLNTADWIRLNMYGHKTLVRGRDILEGASKRMMRSSLTRTVGADGGLGWWLGRLKLRMICIRYGRVLVHYKTICVYRMIRLECRFINPLIRVWVVLTTGIFLSLTAAASQSNKRHRVWWQRIHRIICI